MDRVFRATEVEKAMGFASAIRTGGMLWVSGLVAWDETMSPLFVGDTAGQLGAVYAQLSALLEANGSSMDLVVKETVFTTDIDGLTAAMGERRKFYGAEAVPASTLVGVTRLIHPDLRVEVEVVAAIADTAA